MALLLLVTWQYLASTVFPAGELFGIPACQFLFVSSFFNGWEHSRRSSICFFVISGQQLTRTNKQQTTISTLTGIFTSLFLSSAEQPLKNFITLQIFRWIFLLPPFSHRDWRGVCFSVFVLRNTNHKKAKSRRREKKKKNPKPKRGSERKQLVARWFDCGHSRGVEIDSASTFVQKADQNERERFNRIAQSITGKTREVTWVTFDS